MATFALRLHYGPDDYWNMSLAERAVLLHAFDAADAERGT